MEKKSNSIMEKENINPVESNKFGKNQTFLGNEQKYEKASEMNIDHNVTLEELFKGYISCGVETLKRDGQMMPAAFLICRDYKEEKYKIGIFPMLNTSPGAMQFHSQVLRKLIGDIKAKESKTFKLIGVVIGMDAHMSMVNTNEILDKNGKIDKSKYVPPSKDKNSKDVLHFTLENSFGKHTIAYEYVRSSDGNIVVSTEPLVDTKRPYSAFEDEESNFGYFFAEKMNNN